MGLLVQGWGGARMTKVEMWLSSEFPPHGDEFRIGNEIEKEEVATGAKSGSDEKEVWPEEADRTCR